MNILRKTCRPTVLLGSTALLAASLGLGASGSGGAQPKTAARKGEKKLLLSLPLRTFQPQDHECSHFGAASCPFTTSDGALSSADCLLDDGSHVDFFQFTGVAGQTVTIDLTSIAFDTYLFLLDQTPEVVAQNDDVSPGSNTNSRLSYTLASTGTWTIGVTSFDSSQTGPYTLTLQCTGAPPPPTPTPGPTGPCVADATTLCLNGGRFRVQTEWTTPNGESGQGTAVVETSDTGMFWFFSPNNIEMIIKVVNACAFPGAPRHWVFAGGLTNVAVTATVTDTQTGIVRIYTNPQGTAFAPIQDTNAFPCP